MSVIDGALLMISSIRSDMGSANNRLQSTIDNLSNIAVNAQKSLSTVEDANFAEEVVEECAAFPNWEHDDLADSMTQAILRFRQGGFVIHPDDEKEDKLPRIERTYY